MNNLEKRQNEMRQRMKRQTKAKVIQESTPVVPRKVFAAISAQPPLDISKLQQHIHDLEAEISILRAENERLRTQKTVYVERQKSGDELRREQQHNYFKYSNARRW
jgi:hypothetical protein